MYLSELRTEEGENLQHYAEKYIRHSDWTYN